MKQTVRLFTFVAIAILAIVSTNSQTGSSSNKRYEKDDLAFEYPDGWELSDSSSKEVRTLALTRNGSPAQISVNVEDPSTPGCEFQAQRQKIANTLIENVATQIHAGSAHNALPAATQIGSIRFEGAQLQGVLNHKPVTATVYSARVHQHFVSFIYVLASNDEEAKAAWKTVAATFKLEPGVLIAVGAKDDDGSPTPPGSLNGRALVLPRPDYPKIARSAHASGTVTVQVVIDEEGNVITAHAVDGHPLLQAVSVTAAKAAKFTPMKLCGEPVRVAGVITYAFVAQ